jgi:hypothetical protein
MFSEYEKFMEANMSKIKAYYLEEKFGPEGSRTSEDKENY